MGGFLAKMELMEQVGRNYPSNAFRDFQANIKMAANTGVMLAVCSKNNIEDVREIWAKHPENILRKMTLFVLNQIGMIKQKI